MTTAATTRIPSLFITSIGVAAIGLFLFVGLLNRQNDLAIPCMLVFCILIALKVWSRFAGTGVRHRLTADRNRIFPGERIVLSLSVENHKHLPIWFEVEVPVEGSSSGLARHSSLVGHQSLLWHQGATFEWELAPLGRGVNELGPLHTLAGDLFGFFQKKSENGEKVEIVVYPRIVPLLPLKLPKRDFFGIPGGESPVHDPVYILGTSDYHFGRPAKFIHWKASARHQRLQEKVFDSSEQEKILLLIDTRGFAAAGAGEAFERGIEVLASYAVQFDRRGCAIGLLTNGEVRGSAPSVAVSRGARQLSAVLETLARLQMECRGGLTEVLQGAAMIPWGTTCVCLALREDSETKALVEYLKRRKTPVVLLTAEALSVLTGKGPRGPETFVPSRHSGQAAAGEARRG